MFRSPENPLLSENMNFPFWFGRYKPVRIWVSSATLTAVFMNLKSPLTWGLTSLLTNDNSTFPSGLCCYWNSSVHLFVHIFCCWAKVSWNLDLLNSYNHGLSMNWGSHIGGKACAGLLLPWIFPLLFISGPQHAPLQVKTRLIITETMLPWMNLLQNNFSWSNYSK